MGAGNGEKKKEEGNGALKIRKNWGKWLFVLALIFLVCVANRKVLPEILREAARTSPILIGMSCLLSAGYFLTEGKIIQVMTGLNEPLRHQSAFTWGKGIACAFYCEFYRVATLGSGSGIAEIYYLNSYGVQAGTATGMSLVQYIMYKLAVAAYGIAGFLILTAKGESCVRGYGKLMLLGCLITVLVTAALLFVAIGKRACSVIFTFLKKKGKGRWEEKLLALEEQAELCQKEAGLLLKNPKKLLCIILLNILKVSFWYAVPWLFLAGKIPLSLPEIMLLTALIQMLAAVIPVPSGIGSVEYVFTLFFGVYAGSVSAVSAALMYRFATFLFPCIPGGVLAFRHYRWNKKRKISQAEERKECLSDY